VETAERNRQGKGSRAVALKRNEVVTRTMKKPGKTRIGEDDWNRYVDAIRRETSRGRNEQQANTQKEIENDKN
jgi:hypothetical protein